jgi:hypothetical protein
MKTLQKLKLNQQASIIRSFLFFILFYLYLWRYIEPHLLFHGGGFIRNFPVFYKGWFFFIEKISYPGGFGEYVSALLSQFMYYSWLGALVITTQAIILSLCISYYLKAINALQFMWLRFIPAIIFLILYSLYSFYLPTTMSLTWALIFVWLYISIKFKKQQAHIALFIILSIILYTIAAGAHVIFALLVASYEWLAKRQWLAGLTFVALALFIPYVEGVLIYGTSIADAFTGSTPLFWLVQRYKTDGIAFVYSLFLYLPLITLLIVIWRIFSTNLSKIKTVDKISSASVLANKYIKWSINTGILFVLSIAAIYFSFDSKKKALFLVDYHSYYHNWSQVLEAVKENPNHDLIIAAENRAYYHTGRLGNVTSTLRQNPRVLLLVGEKYTKFHWNKFDIYLDIGYINRAEHHLVEALEFYGERPQILQRLAIINLVKENTGTARIYLGALSKMIFYTEYANNLLQQIKSEPTFAQNKQVQYLRSIMLDQGEESNTMTVDAILAGLLKKNPCNRMAFEYLMTYDLLTKDLNNLAKYIDYFNELKYPKIPRLFEEAILLIASNPKTTIDLSNKNLKINIESVKRFNEFREALGSFKGDKVAAFEKFPKKLRNNYFFFYFFSKQR